MAAKKLIIGDLKIECDVGNVSDGYHTYNELYAHRCALFAGLMKAYPELSWKSKQHEDGSKLKGWFIAGMHLPSGDITYHLPTKQFWSKLSYVKELEFGEPWDGHTPNDVILRLLEWLEL
jgi:hypothetical protein